MKPPALQPTPENIVILNEMLAGVEREGYLNVFYPRWRKARGTHDKAKIIERTFALFAKHYEIQDMQRYRTLKHILIELTSEKDFVYIDGHIFSLCAYRVLFWCRQADMLINFVNDKQRDRYGAWSMHNQNKKEGKNKFVNLRNNVAYKQTAAGKELFCVGEYWSCDTNTLLEYIHLTHGKVKLFDVPLQNNFRTASIMGQNYDMRHIFDGSLVSLAPMHAITFVENHDTQPLQALENVVEPWFKPIAYAITLLRKDGYPCVFYADYYGAEYEDYGRDGNKHRAVLHSHRWIIDKLLFARKEFAYGKQHEYFDYPSCVGWSRVGDDEHPHSMAIIISNGGDGYKWMHTAKANTEYIDLLEHRSETIKTDEYGNGRFLCNGGSVSVWIEKI